jgi:hypothetical protein
MIPTERIRVENSRRKNSAEKTMAENHCRKTPTENLAAEFR